MYKKIISGALKNTAFLFISMLFLVFSFSLLEGAKPPPPKSLNVLDGEWPIVGQDYGNKGNAPSSIDSINAVNLFNNFKFFFPTAGLVLAQPSISNGIAYFGDTSGTLYAVDISTGSLVWSRNLGNEISTTPVVTKDFVYISGGQLFTPPNAPIQIFCINRSDGSVAWSKPISEDSGSLPLVETYTGDVTVVDGLVIFGIASTENAGPATDFKSRGSVVAFDRFSGREKWRFYTTSDQFSDNPEYGAGVGIWSSPGVDLERQVLYIGSGQNYESPTSPYEDSLLALRIKDGKLLWHSPMNINDVWAPGLTPSGPDWDVNTHPNLFSVDIDGEGSVDFVGVADKSGRYYILRRDQIFDDDQGNDQTKIEAILYLDPGARPGAIQATPAIDDVNDILYVASDALIGTNGERVTMDAAPFYGCNAVDIFCFQDKVVSKIAAYDLKVLLNGSHPSVALLWENKSTTDATNKGASFGPLTLSNDVIIQSNGYGHVRILKASDGSLIANTLPLFGQNLPIFGGVTTVGKQVLIPTLGGIVSYELP